MGASGLDGLKGAAVEQLWAEVLTGSLTRGSMRRLAAQYAATPGGAPLDHIADWFTELASRFGPVTAAARTPLSVNGDVDAVLRGGASVKFEVKAQVKKPKFADITQSDWVRDQTDALSQLVQTDADIADHFSPVGASALAAVDVDAQWTTAALHAADLAGLTDAKARSKAGVHTTRDLSSFVQRKWFLHITKEGARLCRFDEIAPIKHMLGGGEPIWLPKVNREGRALQSHDQRGRTWFTYHLYPDAKVKGRHKIHSASFVGVRWV